MAERFEGNGIASDGCIDSAPGYAGLGRAGKPWIAFPKVDHRHVAAHISRETALPCWLAVLTAAFAGVAAASVVLGDWPLLDPDESLFAAIAREMAQRGTWVVPTFQGRTILDRPAPFYWCLCASRWAWGDANWSYRVPNLLFGLGTVIATGLAGRRLFGATSGAAAALCAATMPGILAISMSIGHDAALLFFVTASVTVGLGTLRDCGRGGNRSNAGRVAALAVLLACGTLSKGLLGLVLPGIALAAMASMHCDRSAVRSSFRSLLLGFGAAAAIGGAWYLLAEFHSPGYLRYFFYERHVLGFATSTQRHGGQTNLVYVATLLVGGLPWILLLAGPAARAVRPREWPGSLRSDPTGSGVAFWAASTFVLFLVAGSSNPTYLLPVFPPIAILAGRELSRWISNGSTWSQSADRCLLAMPAIHCGVLGLAIPFALAWFHREWRSSWTLGGAALSVVLVATWLARRRRILDELRVNAAYRAVWAALPVLVMCAAIPYAAIQLLPDIGRERSAQSVVEELRRIGGENEDPILWFNGAPPSAEFYGSDLLIETAYLSQLQQIPSTRTILVARRSRLKEVESVPFVRGSRRFDLGGRYHVFVCGEGRDSESRQN